MASTPECSEEKPRALPSIPHLARVSASHIVSSLGDGSNLFSQGDGSLLVPTGSLQLTPMTEMPTFTPMTEMPTFMHTLSAVKLDIDNCSLKLTPYTNPSEFIDDTIDPSRKRPKLEPECEKDIETQGVGIQTISTGPLTLRSSSINTE